MNSKREAFVLTVAIASCLSLSMCAIAQTTSLTPNAWSTVHPAKAAFNASKSFEMLEPSARFFEIPTSLNVTNFRATPATSNRIEEPSFEWKFAIKMPESSPARAFRESAIVQASHVEIPEASPEVDRSGFPFPVSDAHQVDKVATDNFVWSDSPRGDRTATQIAATQAGNSQPASRGEATAQRTAATKLPIYTPLLCLPFAWFLLTSLRENSLSRDNDDAKRQIPADEDKYLKELKELEAMSERGSGAREPEMRIANSDHQSSKVRSTETQSAQPNRDDSPAVSRTADVQRTFWDLELSQSATCAIAREANRENIEPTQHETGVNEKANPWMENGQVDDFTRLLGIDMEISKVISNAGIDNFAKLTQASVANLRSILDNAGPEFKFVDPSTWPEQAIYASQGNWNLHERWRANEWSDQDEFDDELELLEQARTLVASASDCREDDDEVIDGEQARNMIRSIFLLKETNATS